MSFCLYYTLIVVVVKGNRRFLYVKYRVGTIVGVGVLDGPYAAMGGIVRRVEGAYRGERSSASPTPPSALRAATSL